MAGSSSSRTRWPGKFVLAALAVLLFQPLISQAQRSTLIFYADKDVNTSLWPTLFAAVQEDLANENFGPAGQTFDHSAQLLRASEITPGEEFGNVVEVRLQGRCDVVQQAYRPLQPGPLGWVLRVKGVIQPYIYVDCTRMAQTLNSTTLGMSAEQRSQAMAQAIAHVLVHEWIHITTQNSGHTEHGITEAQLTATTLVSEAGHTMIPEAGLPKSPTPVDIGFAPAER